MKSIGFMTSMLKNALSTTGNTAWLLGSLLIFSTTLHSQDPNMDQLQFTKWSKGINVPDPVAISFGADGRAYVTQTTRRKANDLDIRNNRDWTVNDVSFQSVAEKRAFYLTRLAPELSGQNKRRVKDLNRDGSHDYRDLQQLSEVIHLVEDTNGDGFADSIRKFADGFATEVTGIAAGVLHFEDASNRQAIYATIAPDVWRLEDTDQDRTADRRQKIATGFGLHIAYAGHDMHGLTVGPDGKIYWSIGDKGISVTTKSGDRFHYPNQGGVMRCNPDGTDFEVFAHGLRNVQELAFDQYGNLFGVDNDADQPGERERFVYIVKGMDAGWRCHYQYRGSRYNVWTNEKLWQTFHEGQPAYITPPIQYSINGPCGFAFNPGTALSPRYRNYFFLTGAPHGEQIAFQAEPSGASFRMKDVHQIGKGVALIGINFGPDGALYGVDWANGYPLNQKGAIWKIDAPEFLKDARRKSTHELLQKKLSSESDAFLTQLMKHADQRVRLRAQFEFVNRQDHRILSLLALDHELDQMARVHAIWGLGQLSQTKSRETDWGSLLSDEDPEIVAQTLRVIGDMKEFDQSIFLSSKAVENDSPRVRFFLLQALARHGNSDWLPVLAEIGSMLKPEQVYLRHALAQALAGCDVEQNLNLLNLRKALLPTVVALRMLKSSKVKYFLTEKDSAVRDEAARAIHDDFSIPSALTALAESLDSVSNPSEAYLRRALNANYRLGEIENLLRLVRFISKPGHSELRAEVLDWLPEWEKPDPLDKVTGRFRTFVAERKVTDSVKLRIGNSLTELLSQPDAVVQAAIVRTLGKLKIELDEKNLLEIVLNPASSEKLSIESLKQLANQRSSLLERAIESALSGKKAPLRLAAIRQLFAIDRQECFQQIKSSFDTFKSAQFRQELIRLAAKIRSKESDGFIAKLFKDYLAKQSNADIALELMESVKAASESNSAAKMLQAEFAKSAAERKKGFLAGEFQVSLVGGDVGRGKKLFETHLDAQCTRCHRVGKTGSTVGPPLDKIGSKRMPDHLLNSIINPSAEIEPKYQSVLVGLFSGRTINGVKLEENDNFLTIADSMGKKIKVNKEDIEERIVQKKSLMPDMTKTLSKKEIRDLVAYLNSLK